MILLQLQIDSGSRRLDQQEDFVKRIADCFRRIPLTIAAVNPPLEPFIVLGEMRGRSVVCEEDKHGRGEED